MILWDNVIGQGDTIYGMADNDLMIDKDGILSKRRVDGFCAHLLHYIA